MEDVKIKLSVLWVMHSLAGLFLGVVMLLEPDVLEGIMDGKILGMQIAPEILLVVSIEFLVPFFMVFLSLTLKNSINRWANIILGAVFAVIALASLGEAVAKSTGYSAYAMLMGISAVVAQALIVWYAWKWPKQGE